MRKKKWKKPELIVLVRGKPEEAVLSACKTVTGGIGAGPALNVSACDSYTYKCDYYCSARNGT